MSLAEMKDEFTNVVADFANYGDECKSLYDFLADHPDNFRGYTQSAHACHQELLISNPAYKILFGKYVAHTRQDHSVLEGKVHLALQEKSDFKSNLKGLWIIATHPVEIFSAAYYEHRLWKMAQPRMERHLIIEMA